MLSVVLCSHNPRPPYLQRTLAALKAQSLALNAWEFILVDNASSPPIAPAFDISWHPRGRHVREPELGLTRARMRGIAEAQGDILVFVDDDNELDPLYLENTVSLAAEHPRIGCFGAAIICPEFEVPPALHLEPHLEYLALRVLTEDRWSNRPADGIIPWGAGLVVRANIARRFVDEVTKSPLRQRLGRSGKALLSGEDDEFSWIACGMGYGKGLFLRLRLTHLIPRERLEPAYLFRLVEGTTASGAILRHLHGEPPENDRTPSLLNVLETLLRGRLSHALIDLNEWLVWLRLPPTRRRIAQAIADGRRRAREMIASMTS